MTPTESFPIEFVVLGLVPVVALLATFPLVLVPAFAVPVAILLHGASPRQLRRMPRIS